MTASPSAPTVDPRLARTLWQWIALGALALLAWPAARGQGEWFGWGPYWAVIAPAIALGVAYRHRLWARVAEDAVPGTAHRRRARGSRAQPQRPAATRRDRQRRVA